MAPISTTTCQRRVLGSRATSSLRSCVCKRCISSPAILQNGSPLSRGRALLGIVKNQDEKWETTGRMKTSTKQYRRQRGSMKPLRCCRLRLAGSAPARPSGEDLSRRVLYWPIDPDQMPWADDSTRADMEGYRGCLSSSSPTAGHEDCSCNLSRPRIFLLNARWPLSMAIICRHVSGNAP